MSVVNYKLLKDGVECTLVREYKLKNRILAIWRTHDGLITIIPADKSVFSDKLLKRLNEYNYTVV